MGAGASVNVSSFTSSPHVGTHADAPLHVREGWSGSHELSLDAFFGPAIVVDVTSLEKQIAIEDLEKTVFLLGRKSIAGVVLNGTEYKTPEWLRRLV